MTCLVSILHILNNTCVSHFWFNTSLLQKLVESLREHGKAVWWQQGGIHPQLTAHRHLQPPPPPAGWASDNFPHIAAAAARSRHRALAAGWTPEQGVNDYFKLTLYSSLSPAASWARPGPHAPSWRDLYQLQMRTTFILITTLFDASVRKSVYSAFE